MRFLGFSWTLGRTDASTTREASSGHSSAIATHWAPAARHPGQSPECPTKPHPFYSPAQGSQALNHPSSLSKTGRGTSILRNSKHRSGDAGRHQTSRYSTRSPRERTRESIDLFSSDRGRKSGCTQKAENAHASSLSSSCSSCGSIRSHASKLVLKSVTSGFTTRTVIPDGSSSGILHLRSDENHPLSIKTNDKWRRSHETADLCDLCI